MTDSNHDSAWFEERVEAFVDGELSADELKVFETRLAADATLQQSVNDARTVISVLRTASRAHCPDVVSDRVLQLARGGSLPDTGLERRDRQALRRVPILRRVTVRTVAIAAAACLAVLLFLKQPAPPENYSEAEVQQALREAKYALAIVSNASKETAKTIRMDAMPAVNDAFDRVLNEGQEARRVGHRQDDSETNKKDN